MLRILMMFSKREWFLIVLSLGLVVLGVWLELTLPEYLGRITQIVVGSGNETIGRVWELGAIMLALALGSTIVAISVAWIGSVVSSGHAARLRKQVFERVGDFSLAEMKSFSVASLITRSTNDVNQIRLFSAVAIQILIRAPLLAAWAILRILGTSWELSLVTFIAVAALVAVITVLIIVILPRFNRIQTLTDKINQVSRENLTGIRVVRAFGAQDYEQEKFEKANKALVKNNLIVNRGFAIFWPFMMFLMSGLTVAIFWVGSAVLTTGSVSDPGAYFGDMMVFTQYSVMIIFSFVMLIMVLIMFPRTLVSARRIREILQTESSVRSENDLTTNEYSLKFENVNFKYPGAQENVLTDINLEIPAGQTIAFIGSTGSGKSTLVNLLPRIYDATSGEILIGGVNIKGMSLEALSSVVGYVPQTAVLFNGTIKSNVAFGEVGKDEISDTDVKAALKTAQAWNFVSELENGVDADVAQAGKNLSGGQKQRIGIARVLARKPKILIFDDTFSALDYKTDKSLRAALKKDVSATVLIVAQRIGTIKDCDKIFVLDKGRIVGQGTHDELMKTNEIYKEIAKSQQGGAK